MRLRTTLAFTVLAAAAWLLPLPARAAQAVTAAIVLSAQGTVEWAPAPPDETWSPAEADDRLAPGSRVRTGRSSSARLRLPDGSLLVLSPKSSFQIEEADASAGSLRARINLFFGTLWANVLKVSNVADVRVAAHGTVVGVRGTNFSVESDEKGKEVEVGVSEGAVSVASGGEETEVRAGFRYQFRKAKAQIRELSRHERDQFLEIWKFVPEVRDAIRSSFRAVKAETKRQAKAVGEFAADTAKTVGSGVADVSKEAAHEVAQGARSVKRAIKGVFAEPAMSSGTARPIVSPPPAEKE